MSMKEKMLRQMSALGTPALKSIQELEKKVDKVYDKMDELISAIGHHDDWMKWFSYGKNGPEPVWIQKEEEPSTQQEHKEIKEGEGIGGKDDEEDGKGDETHQVQSDTHS